MFGAPFSRLRFSLPRQDGNEIPIRLAVRAGLNGYFGAGADAKIKNMPLSARFTAMAGGVSALPDDFLAEARFHCTARGLQAIGILAAPTLRLGFSGEIGANLYTAATPAARVEGELQAGADIYNSFMLAAALDCQALLGANLYYGLFFTALLSGLADAALLEEQVVEIAGSIPPGSELRIDSGNFTVTLDGKNILHQQQGDWIVLERELAALTVDSGSGSQLSGSIIYTEKYL